MALGLSQAVYLENRILVGIIQYNGHQRLPLGLVTWLCIVVSIKIMSTTLLDIPIPCVEVLVCDTFDEGSVVRSSDADNSRT